jgi:hypothetical protein
MLVALVGIVSLGGQLAAMGANDPLTGAWYGGSTAPDGTQAKWIYIMTPVRPGRWVVECQGAFSPMNFGAPIVTEFGGEIRKKGTEYELRLVCLTQSDTTPRSKNLPTIVAGRAVLTILGPGQIRATYDSVGFWKWDTVPFVDQAAVWAYRRDINPPTVETLYRLSMDVEINLK